MTAVPIAVEPNSTIIVVPYEPLPDGSSRSGDFTICLMGDGNKNCTQTPFRILPLPTGAGAAPPGTPTEGYLDTLSRAIPVPTTSSPGVRQAFSFAQQLISNFRAQIQQVKSGNTISLPVVTATGIQSAEFGPSSLATLDALVNNSGSSRVQRSTPQSLTLLQGQRSAVGGCSETERGLLTTASAFRTLENLGSALDSISNSKIAQGAMCFVDLNNNQGLRP